MTQDQERSENKQRKLSFAVYVTGAFVLTAVLTVLITASMIIVSWNINRGRIFDDQDLYFAILMAGIVALVISVVLGLFIGAQIVTPVRKISKAARDIKAGNLDARTGLQGDDELYRLGETFDEMADAMQRDRDLERRLIGDVAHELRTPVMAIQATVEAIQDGVFEADEERMATLSSETLRLGRLIDALLHLNRLENGVTKLNIVTIDLSGLVTDLVVVHEALVDSVGLTLKSRVAEHVLIEGDRDLIKQAIGNLISNAVRYTPDGGNVSIDLERENGFARVSVKDTGIGIGEEDIKWVFSRFWRADEAREAGTGGLGIGLSLVREVADQHRGSVAVESVLGSGSVFSISLPLSSDDPLVAVPASKSDERRMARENRREQDRARRDQERSRKKEDRVRRDQERSRKQVEERTRKQAEKLRKIQERETRSYSRALFGIQVPTFSRKGNDDRQE